MLLDNVGSRRNMRAYLGTFAVAEPITLAKPVIFRVYRLISTHHHHRQPVHWAPYEDARRTCAAFSATSQRRATSQRARETSGRRGNRKARATGKRQHRTTLSAASEDPGSRIRNKVSRSCLFVSLCWALRTLVR